MPQENRKDYNEEFENENFVWHRQNVCYDLMFNDLPIADLHEDTQDGPTPTPGEDANMLEK